ncbi:MAG TPA: protein kinase [Polyangiales bacterium]|nr:protein kinase [Polyangiales bacterium]
MLGGRWVLESLLARGGMGVLYVGRHMQTGRRAAIKVINEATDEMLARFRIEASVCAQIGHPGVVDVFDADQDPATNSAFIAMELLQGCTLRKLMDDAKSTPERVLSLLMSALEPLAAAHAKGFVHRDLKPENLFVLDKPEGGVRVKLLDFGIVASQSQTRLTRHGMAMGTPHYMSPEQAMSAREVTPASDVWAMGVMLYEAIKGDVPFDGETSHAVIVQALTVPHMPLDHVVPGVDPAIARLIDKCMEKAPDARPRDAAELLTTLQPLLRSHSLPSVRPSFRVRNVVQDTATAVVQQPTSTVRSSLRVRSVKNAANILAASGVVCSLSALALPFVGVGAPLTTMFCAVVGGGLLFTASKRVNALQTLLQQPPVNIQYVPRSTEARQAAVVLSQHPKRVVHPLRGSPDAPVRIELFADLSCAISRRACQRVISLRVEHPEHISVVFKPYWDLQRDMAPATAEMVRTLFEREGAEVFWAFFDRFLTNTRRVTNDLLFEYASAVCTDKHGLQRALRTQSHRKSVQTCRDEAQTQGVDQSPTVIINGTMLAKDISEDRLRWAYVDALSGVEQRRKVELGETRTLDNQLSNDVMVRGLLVRYRGARNAPAGMSRTREEARERARKLGERARMQGADFANVALRFADALIEPEDLTHRLREPMVADAVTGLAIGEMSQPVECDEGYQVLQRVS